MMQICSQPRQPSLARRAGAAAANPDAVHRSLQGAVRRPVARVLASRFAAISGEHLVCHWHGTGYQRRSSVDVP